MNATSALSRLAGNDPPGAEAAQHGGIAWALTGLIRSLPFLRPGQLSPLPRDMLAAAGVDGHAVARGPAAQPVRDVVRQVAGRARFHLQAGRTDRTKIAAAARPALLPMGLADLYLDRLERAGFDVTDRRLAVGVPRRLVRLTGLDQRTFAAPLIFGNTGNLGLPLALFEVRQDLIDTHHGAEAWTHLLYAALKPVLAMD